ncbi:14-3-3 protein epsilon [Nilaparvata lugens]|uniref:14-3-3 protein epsilon n=1 Tax=Nilaparvata lugens TaxID=108931 RepID=UPI00193D4A4D|nr:14-3-3 protein epsilon [Nilaparvata lugens]
MLNIEERNLLATAYKHEVTVRRSSLQILNNSAKNEANGKSFEVISGLRKNAAKEIQMLCIEVIGLLDNFLLPSAVDLENSVFYLRIKGDHWRYVAEISNNYYKKNAVEQAIDAYKCASEIAVLELPSCHPTRLGLALNFSVFLYEILNSPHRACRMCSAAYHEAIQEINNLTDWLYKDATLILQLMNDNLMLWLADVIVKEPKENT